MTTKSQNSRDANSQSLVSLMVPLARLARIMAPTADQADDLAQEALMQVWARLKQGGTIKDLRPYLMTTLRNASRHIHVPDRELNDANTPSCPPDAHGRIVCRDVCEAMARLPAEQRDLMHPLIRSGTSYKQLAEIHDLPIGTVMSRIARARAGLRRDLDLPTGHAVDVLLDDRQ